MRIAAGLLTRFGVDDALVGDLIEQRNAGRSGAWLWRQVAGAVVSALAQDVTARPVRTVVAVLVGSAARLLIVRAWAPHELSFDAAIASAVDVVSLSTPLWLLVLAWANSILLAPAWFGIGFVVARLSRGAVLIFVGLATAFLLPSMTRQLEYAVASDIVRWHPPVQLTIYATSIAAFVLSTLAGAACGLGKTPRIT